MRKRFSEKGGNNYRSDKQKKLQAKQKHDFEKRQQDNKKWGKPLY